MMFYIVLVAVSIWIYVYLIRERRTKVPPGMKVIPVEKGLPIIGVANEIKEPLCNYLTKLSKKHGPIYFIRFGMRDVLVLNNFEYMKAALVDNGQAFCGRWCLFPFIYDTRDFGILYLDGNRWVEQRSFILKTLKEFGIGRSRSVEIVQDECLSLLKNLEQFNSQKLDFSEFISLHTANAISKFIMNKTFAHQDPDLRAIEEMMRCIASVKDDFLIFCLMFPFLDRNLWLMKFLVWVTSRNSLFEKSQQVFQREIDKHLAALDVNSGGEDLIERFLVKQHQMKEKDGKVGSFTDWQLLRIIFELFLAGYDTTSSTLTWSCMLMAMYPEVQEKVHEEICDTIGNERLPTMSDKASLTYTQAVMDEILRLSTAVPLGLIHRTLEPTCVNGYFVPKDTLVLPNLFSCHVDPTIWERPLEFYPAHFLSTDKEGAYEYKPREELVLFSMGKRQCLGESLARTEYFIFFTSILQRFQVSLADVTSKKMDLHELPSSDGIIRKPFYTNFTFKGRN